jgi:hypothetical protein
MLQKNRFSAILPAVQCGLAAFFGGFGLWQRSVILSRPFIGDQTLWNSTARFHVWPWPYKFAAVLNLPAFVGGSLLLLPIHFAWRGLPEFAELLPSLVFTLILWHGIGSRLDQRWRVTSRTPWIAILVFTVICLGGAILPIGYVGYFPWGVVVWVIAALLVPHASDANPRRLTPPATLT